MIVIKSKYPRDKYEDVYGDLWLWVFNKHVDISKPEAMVELLGKHFSKGEVEEIMRLTGTQEVKDKLTDATKYAISKGAFGAPWFVLRNDKGEEEPMFGSDRWNYMFKFMGVEFNQMEIVDRNGKAGAKL